MPKNELFHENALYLSRQNILAVIHFMSLPRLFPKLLDNSVRLLTGTPPKILLDISSGFIKNLVDFFTEKRFLQDILEGLRQEFLCKDSSRCPSRMHFFSFGVGGIFFFGFSYK